MALDFLDSLFSLNIRRKEKAIDELRLMKKEYESLAKSANETILTLYEERKRASDLMAKVEENLRSADSGETLLSSFAFARDRIRQFDEVKREERKIQKGNKNALGNYRTHNTPNSLNTTIESVYTLIANTTFGHNVTKSAMAALSWGASSILGSTTSAVAGSITTTLSVAGFTILSLFLPAALPLIAGKNLRSIVEIKQQTEEIRKRKEHVNRFKDQAQKTISLIKNNLKELKVAVETEQPNEILATANTLADLINKHFDI